MELSSIRWVSSTIMLYFLLTFSSCALEREATHEKYLKALENGETMREIECARSSIQEERRILCRES